MRFTIFLMAASTALLCGVISTWGCRPASSGMETGANSDAKDELASGKTAVKSETPMQLLLVSVPDASRSEAVVTGLGRANAEAPWIEELAEMPAQIGRNGTGEPGVKMERDGKSPLGEFAFMLAFGRDAEAPEGVTFPYRQAREHDFWVDDPASPDYNRWVSGDAPTVSHERLRLAGGNPVYDLALTLDFNTNPVVPGAGSAIFLHIWESPTTPTSGCVSLSRKNVLKILRWLDAKKNPHIRIEAKSPDAS